MSLDDKTIVEYATEQYGTKPEGQTSEAAIVTETTTEGQSTTAETEGSTAAIATPEGTTTTEQTTETTETSTSTEAPVIDYGKILDEISGGIFKDVDTFKSAIPKLTDYDAIVSAKTEQEELLKSYIKPANDYVKHLNDMVLAGKSQDEIENFQKISKLDIDQLSDAQVKVMAMVKQGYSETIAKQIVDRDFPLDDFEEGTTERQILEEELRVSAKSQREELKEYKKELTTIVNPAAEAAEQKRLEDIAAKSAHESAVKSVVPKIVEGLTGLGEKLLTGKEGEDAVKLKFDYSDEYKSGLNDRVENFFIESGLPVTEENIQLAQKYVQADYLVDNIDSILQAACKHQEAITTEKIVNKYENRSGLTTDPVNEVNIDTTAREKDDFMLRIAQGR